MIATGYINKLKSIVIFLFILVSFESNIPVFSSEKGYVRAMESDDVIESNVAVAGYFLEDKSSVTKDDYILFNVQGNYEFN